jgi:hypothetical protein
VLHKRPVKNYDVFASDVSVCVKTLSASYSLAAGLTIELIDNPIKVGLG